MKKALLVLSLGVMMVTVSACTGGKKKTEYTPEKAVETQAPAAENTAPAVAEKPAEKPVEEEVVKQPTIKMARASHILIGYQGATMAKPDLPYTDQAAAKAKAEEILAELQAAPAAELVGMFAEKAKEFSTGPSAVRGGDLGVFPAGRMVKPFDEAVFATDAETLVPELVETPFGYHIIYVAGFQEVKR